MSFLCSVLKPFGDLSSPEKQQSVMMTSIQGKKSKLFYVPFFYENLHKCQSESVSVESLLNRHLSVLPFKPYFEQLYRVCEIFYRLDYICENLDQQTNKSTATTTNLQQQLLTILADAGCCYSRNYAVSLSISSSQSPTPLLQQSPAVSHQFSTGSSSLDEQQLQINDLLIESMSKLEALNNETAAALNNCQLKREIIQDQKFYLALLHLPALLHDMTDPRKCQLAQSVCNPALATDSLDLVLAHVQSLFTEPRTCVNSLLHLFGKLARFIGRVELLNRFLPIVVQVLNVVDLNETLGIDLTRDLADDETKTRFCKLFDYAFINELRIIFGLKVFLTQICPFLIEAISGFKDFEFDSSSIHHQQQLDSISVSKQTAADNQGLNLNISFKL